MKWCLIVTILFSQAAFSEETEVDHVELAKILVRDGYYQRAERTLQKVSKEETENNKALLSSLWGMVYLQKQKYEKALGSFNQAIKNGLKEKEIHLYRAEAFLQLEKLGEAGKALSQVGEEEKQKLPFYLLQAEIFWKQDEKIKAWKTLDQGLAKKLSKVILEKKKFSYLLQEKLFQAASDKAYSLLQTPDAYNDVLAMASQLRVAGENKLSLEILQTLQIMRPEKEMVALEMAQNYLALGEGFSAALILEKSAKHNISLSFEASEMLRQIGKSYRARFLNMYTTDPAKQLKQKLALYLEDDDYLSLKFMIPQLRKSQLLEDQEIRYAVAYSLFRIGDFNRSEEYLNTIDKDGLFEKSIELKREITNCREEKWACSETI